MSAALAFEDVTVALGGRSIISRLSFSLRPGEVLAVCGANGAGKSTVARAAAGLLSAKGRITLLGRPLTAVSRTERARRLAYVAQAPAAPPGFTVRQLVALGRTPFLGLLGAETRRDREAIRRAMVLAGVDGLAARHVNAISGGERQRVSIARALAQTPQVLVLDEPTSNLDLGHQATFLGLLGRLAREEGLAAMVVLHDLNLAGLFCDRLLLLDEGRAVAFGPPPEVLQPSVLMAVYRTPLHILDHPDRGPVVVHALDGSLVPGAREECA